MKKVIYFSGKPCTHSKFDMSPKDDVRGIQKRPKML